MQKTPYTNKNTSTNSVSIGVGTVGDNCRSVDVVTIILLPLAALLLLPSLVLLNSYEYNPKAVVAI